MTNGWHRRNPNTPASQARKRQYNSREHRMLRAKYKREVDAGTAHCWRCGRWLPPGQLFHAGHDDHDRTTYRGPECPPCNLHAASLAGRATQTRTRQQGADYPIALNRT